MAKKSNDIISVVTRKNDINGSLLVIILCLAQKKVKSEAMVLFHWKNLFYSLAVAPTKASFQVFSLSRQKYHSKTMKGTIGIVSEFKNDAWRQVGTLQQPRYGHTAIIFNNLIYVIGGKGNVFDQEWYFRSTSGQASGQAGTILVCIENGYRHSTIWNRNLETKWLLDWIRNYFCRTRIERLPDISRVIYFKPGLYLYINYIILFNCEIIWNPGIIIELLFTYLHIRNIFGNNLSNEFSYSLHGKHIA